MNKNDAGCVKIIKKNNNIYGCVLKGMLFVLEPVANSLGSPVRTTWTPSSLLTFIVFLFLRYLSLSHFLIYIVFFSSVVTIRRSVASIAPKQIHHYFSLINFTMRHAGDIRQSHFKYNRIKRSRI